MRLLILLFFFSINGHSEITQEANCISYEVLGVTNSPPLIQTAGTGLSTGPLQSKTAGIAAKPSKIIPKKGIKSKQKIQKTKEVVNTLAEMNYASDSQENGQGPLSEHQNSLSNYEKEKSLLEIEIGRIKEESAGMSVNNKKKKYSNEIKYETKRMRRSKDKVKIREIPVEMREETDVIELKIH